MLPWETEQKRRRFFGKRKQEVTAMKQIYLDNASTTFPKPVAVPEAMYRYLTGHGINGDRLIREEESTSTKENLEFSRRKIGTTDCSVGVVTNNFHVWRGAAIARKCGFREVAMVPSRYRSWRLFIYIPREILAIIKDKLMGNL